MTTSIILLCIFAALLELDTTYAFQLTLSRPIIAAPLFSLFTGDIMAGIQVGIFAELLFVDSSPLGGEIPPSGVVACVIPLILYSLGIDLYFGFFLGILAALLYAVLDRHIRKTRFKWLVFLEKNVGKKPTVINRTIAASLVTVFLMNFIYISVLAWACTQLMYHIFVYIPVKAHFAFKFAYMAVPWIGLATLIPTFRLKMR